VAVALTLSKVDLGRATPPSLTTGLIVISVYVQSLFYRSVSSLRYAMFKTVLFPIDMSAEAQHAAAKVAELVKVHQSRLVVLSVVEPAPAEVQTAGQSSPEVVAQLLGKAKELFAAQAIEAEVLERQGQPAFVICDVADELNADLIVMGCRGVGLIEEVQDESVTMRVINLSPCPVMIIP
jgi:nucleotide-binding universal stress UspA family protein